MKSMLIKTRAYLLVAAAVLVGSVGTSYLVATPAFASPDTNTDQIEVRVPNVIDIEAINPGSNGTLTVNSATVSVTFRVVGAGLITIEDQNGNILFSQNRTNSTEETITVNITLPGGPGTYSLTLSIFDPSIGIVSDSFTIVYQPDGGSGGTTPGVPDTGFIRIGNQEYSVASISVLGVIMAALAIIVIALKRRDKRNRQVDTKN